MKDYEIMEKMYRGEEKRDASSKIRGFLFQDLIAVSKLAKEVNRRVFLEYTEDITIITDRETYIIQSKYYPKTVVGTSEMSKIIRDLYYQYMRLEILGYAATVIPILAIHSNNKPDKPTLEEMQGENHINVNRNTKPEYPDDVETWLEGNVYKEKKEVAESILFEKFAWNQSMQAFLDVLTIQSDYEAIETYRKQVAEELDKLDFSGCLVKDEGARKNILVGLAVQFIQEKYNDPKDDRTLLEHKIIEREEFVHYLQNNICTETEESIGAYLHAVVSECWEAIVKSNPQFTLEENDTLEYIRDRTMDWIFDLACEPQGQFRLLNTVSNRTLKELKGYCSKSIEARRNLVCEHYGLIQDFLMYFWKMIINVNKDLLNEPMKCDSKKKLDPRFYINEEEQQYVSICFTEEEAGSVVILPEIGKGRKGEKLTNIFERMEKVQPKKWYMCGDYRGRYRYDLNVSEIKRGHTVSSIATNQFRIECMECIKIDEECWSLLESCKENIFLDKCIKYKGEDE